MFGLLIFYVSINKVLLVKHTHKPLIFKLFMNKAKIF
ncbi:hypothetical protein MHA_1267 [Mannheimia haemolytica PHL213]|nr:hypothetical protein MHA_1267 [Mannheimia haemolytica PHL213]